MLASAAISHSGMGLRRSEFFSGRQQTPDRETGNGCKTDLRRQRRLTPATSKRGMVT